MDNPNELKQLDRVQLLTTKNVTYLSDRPDSMPSPHGYWTIVGFVEKEALVCKGMALVRIPIKDITKVGGYGTEYVLNSIKDLIKRNHSGKKAKKARDPD